MREANMAKEAIFDSYCPKNIGFTPPSAMKTAFLLLFYVTLTHAYHFSSFGSFGLKRLHSHLSHPPSHPPSTSALSAERTFVFSKYHGLGNDFVLVNDLDKDAPSLTSEESAKICDRNFGGA